MRDSIAARFGMVESGKRWTAWELAPMCDTLCHSLLGVDCVGFPFCDRVAQVAIDAR